MCNCATVCRVPDVETSDGRWPMPAHSPACEDFKQERFVRLKYDGSWCVMEPDDAQDTIGDAPIGVEYEVEDVFLTRDQFEALPEFAGF